MHDRDLRPEGRLPAHRGREWHAVHRDQNPSPVGVVLRLGGTRYCMSFGGTTAFVPDVHFGGTDAPAPAACPP